MGLDIRLGDLQQKVVEVPTEGGQAEDGFFERLDDRLGLADSIIGKVERLAEHPMLKQMIERKLGKKMAEAGRDPSSPVAGASRSLALSQAAQFLSQLEGKLGDVTVAEAMDQLLSLYGDLRLSQLRRNLG